MRSIYLSTLYFIHRWILRTSFLLAYLPRFRLYFKFKTPDVIGRHIYKGRVHEEELTNFLLGYLKFEEGDCWFDIGANIGWYSLVLSQQFSSRPTAYAFEPDPLNYSLLKENIKLNGVRSVIAENQALSDQEATKLLYQYPAKNSGRHSLLPLTNVPGIKVSATSLDHYVVQRQIDISSIKFIKMDIEGYEYIALRGAKTLLHKVPCLLCEFSPAYMERGGINSQDLLDLMSNHNYQPFKITDYELRSLSHKEILSFTSNVNIFWKKNHEKC